MEIRWLVWFDHIIDVGFVTLRSTSKVRRSRCFEYDTETGMISALPHWIHVEFEAASRRRSEAGLLKDISMVSIIVDLF